MPDEEDQLPTPSEQKKAKEQDAASDAAKSGAEPGADSIDAKLSDINVMLTNLLNRAGATGQKDIWYFLSSGVFFMLVGASTLIFAFVTMGTTHASFTFILVVVGVAILLYGTGTQGAGNFETTAGEMKYKVGVAGGAGILAFAVALGIVVKSKDIRDAFQIEKKYARLTFRDPGDGIASMGDYVADISVDGVPVPSYRTGEYIIAYVPFSGGTADRQVEISANFFYVKPDGPSNKLELKRVPFRTSVPFRSGEITTDDAGFDFPRLKPDLVVKLSDDELPNNPDESQLAAITPGSAPAPGTNIPPAVVQPFQ